MVSIEDIIKTKAEAFRLGNFDSLDLFPKQIEAMNYLVDQHVSEVGYGGGAGGGKSFLGCEWLTWSCIAYPETKWFVGRQFLSEIRESTLYTLFRVFKKHRIPSSMYKYKGHGVKIDFSNGSSIKGLDLAYKPSDPDYNDLGSTEYTGGWIEEAGGIHVKARQILDMRIGRWYNDRYGIAGKMLITFNPSKNWLYNRYYKPYINGSLPDNIKFVKSLVTDNTKRESGYEQRLNMLTGEARARLYLGDWDYDDDQLSLCELSAISDIFTNDFNIVDESKKRMVCDIAMHGSDLYRIGIFCGNVLIDSISIAKSGGRDVLNAVKEMQMKHGIRGSRVLYDADGVGAFLGGKGGFITGAIAFHGGAVPFKDASNNGNEYANLRSQCGFSLANAINEGKVWVKCRLKPEESEVLSEELSHLKKDKDVTEGKLRLKPKDKVKRDLGRSPDFSDIFLMNQYFELMEKIGLKKTGYSVYI